MHTHTLINPSLLLPPMLTPLAETRWEHEKKGCKKPPFDLRNPLARVRLKLPVRRSGCIHLTWCVDVQAAGRPTAGEGRPYLCLEKRLEGREGL